MDEFDITFGEVEEMAKRFAYANKASWLAYVDDVREALIDSFVLRVVMGRDMAMPASEIQLLRSFLGVRLNTHHKMPNPIAEENK